MIGLLLGRMMEGELVRTLQISGGRPFAYLMERPIAMGLFVVMILVLVGAPLLKSLRRHRQRRTGA